jgi:hypothetical protein
MSSFEPAGIIKTFRSGGGEVTVWFPGGDLVAARIVGHVRTGLATAAFAELDRYGAAHCHPGRGFIDFTQMTDFDWDARMTLVRWNLANRAKATRVDLMTESRAVQMALRALASILGDRMVAHQDRATFIAAYTSAVSKRVTAKNPTGT